MDLGLSTTGGCHRTDRSGLATTVLPSVFWLLKQLNRHNHSVKVPYISSPVTFQHVRVCNVGCATVYIGRVGPRRMLRRSHEQIILSTLSFCYVPCSLNACRSLPLVYAGYGLLGGTGVGLAYTPPVQALISWFPDKRGLASGLTIAG